MMQMSPELLEIHLQGKTFQQKVQKRSTFHMVCALWIKGDETIVKNIPRVTETLTNTGDSSYLQLLQSNLYRCFMTF